MIKQDLGERMKRYESITQSKLIPHMPTIIRIDGKTFHSYVKYVNASKPFSDKLHNIMTSTMVYLCRDLIQNAVFGYTQSDEISILLKDWPNFNTDQWFSGKVQKITSVSASGASAYFNTYHEFENAKALAIFDARVFQLPVEEICNYFIWRQQDAIRNSIQSFGQVYFSHKQLNKVTCNQIKEMIYDKTGLTWEHLPGWQKNGSAIKEELDEDVPIFSTDRTYIEMLY